MPRPRKVPQVLSLPDGDNDAKSTNGCVINNWSTEECHRLVEYIKKNGFDGDVPKILKHFPGHTETNFRQLMRMLEDKPAADGDQQLWKTVETLENLLERARENHLSLSQGSVLPSIVESTANFAEYPPVAETPGGVDYGEIVRTVAALMRGEIPRALSAPTAAKFLEVIDKFLVNLMNLSCGSNDNNDNDGEAAQLIIKRPVKSAKKEAEQRNATLASRRSETWSTGEINKAAMLLTLDLATVREIYLAPSWSNPYRFPDKPSQFRMLKIASRFLREVVGPANVTKPGKKAVKPMKKKRRPK